MRSFFVDTANAFHDLWLAMVTSWEGLGLNYHVLVFLGLIALLIYLGARTERTGFSAILFMSAFGLFSYVVIIGYAIMH